MIPAIVFLLLWQNYVNGDTEREFLFASPLLILDVAKVELFSAQFWGDVGLTAEEALLGFLLGSFLGCTGGLLLWSSRKLAELSRVYIVILGSIPIFAIAPMLIIWFGTGMLSKVVMAAFAVFFVTLSQVYDGARAIANERLIFAQSLGAPSWRVARKIIIPGSLVWVIAALRMNVSLALVGAFIGEFVSSERGLGHYILKAGSLFDLPRVLFGVMLLSLLGLLLSSFVGLLEKRVVAK